MENVIRIAENIKTCTGCKKLKPLSEFVKIRKSGDKLQAKCKACLRDIKKKYYHKIMSDPVRAAKRKEANKRYDGAEHRARYWYKFKYGLTIENLMVMYKAQFGKCANTGCGREIKLFTKMKTADNACVDHDHRTGKIRALLCRPCNAILGTLEAQGKVVAGLLEYKIKHQEIS